MQTRVCKDERTWQHRPQASALNPWSLCQVGLEQRLANAKKKASQMEELLPTQVISEDHREVLRLLCRAHELELENMGLQANSLCRRNLLCQKDFVIQRCQQHRRLCEQIIREQQQLIQGEAPPRRPLLGPPSLSGLLSGKATNSLVVQSLGPGSGRSPGEGNGNPHQYSCLENPRDTGAWQTTFPGVAQCQTRLSD